MKKSIFASILFAVALILSSCTTEVTMDSFIYVEKNSSWSWSSGQSYTTGLDDDAINDLSAEIVKEKGYEMMNKYSVVIRAQKKRADVIDKAKDFADELDKRIKAKYGNPVKVDTRYSKLQVNVTAEFGNTGKETVAVFTYK